MNDDEILWERDEIDSPCVKICLIDPQTRFCMGCGRTMQEIKDWSNLDQNARASLKAELKTRLENTPKRKRTGRARKSRL